ncbi:hypothetical protein FJU08_07805 [Martelella alba]|uniref:Uncharacterized protein n=1 Tax=Martelella alba TaxID=2590451 RepID=A0A506UEP5_9HYPH|nr:hypothetical protein FJU08_07805 [Martelella alba]
MIRGKTVDTKLAPFSNVMPVPVTGIQPTRVRAAKDSASVQCHMKLDPRDRHGDDDGGGGYSAPNRQSG